MAEPQDHTGSLPLVSSSSDSDSSAAPFRPLPRPFLTFFGAAAAVFFFDLGTAGVSLKSQQSPAPIADQAKHTRFTTTQTPPTSKVPVDIALSVFADRKSTLFILAINNVNTQQAKLKSKSTHHPIGRNVLCQRGRGCVCVC